MGCVGSKTQGKPTPEVYVDGVIEDKIFALMKDSFCASGPEATLFGGVLKDEMLIKIQTKMKKLQEIHNELEKQPAADYFINKVALVDPVEGEIVIPYDRVMTVCQKFDIDELHLLYERLRCVKVSRLRETHGSDIISIINDEGQAQYSECGRGRRGSRRIPNGPDDDQLSSGEDSGSSVFDLRNLGIN